MGEIRLSHCCRLCLKEGFSLTNIFSQCSESGDPLYQILNFIYEMKILENDGLPSQISSPCMWRMIEFDACKKNVRSAEVEIRRLLSQTRPDEPSEVEVGMELRPVNSEVSIKDEMEIVEWEMPSDTVIKVPESSQHFQEADKDDYDDIESDDSVESNEIDIEEWIIPKELKREAMDFGKADEVTVEEFEDNCNQQVFSRPLRETSQGIVLELKQEELIIEEEEAIQTPVSSGLTNILSVEASEGNSFEGESICTTQGISVEIRDANKGINEEDPRDDIVPEGKSLSSEMSKSNLEVKKSGRSRLEAPLSKKGFICDICKRSCTTKQILGRHVRVHYDERPFSCDKCDKRFKFDNVRYEHELRHLRDEINSGKIETETKKGLYSCDLCAKNFNSKKGLWIHSNVHRNKYKCNSCGKCFVDNATLRRHTMTHTKEKPFKCDFCSKYFARKSNLNRHLLLHSSERQHICDICDKKFKTKGDKTKHALQHFRKK